jgi:hypothetical protein
VEGRRHPREFALNVKRTILAQFALVTQAFGEFSWITLRPPAAATGLNKVEQDRAELTGASNPDWAICGIHRRAACKPARSESEFSSMRLEQFFITDGVIVKLNEAY